MRWRSFKYGITYFRSEDFKIPPSIRVNGIFRDLHFNDRGEAAFKYEFREICIEDCYRLKKIRKQLGRIKNIVDIGANQGLFLLAARQFFPAANISCYEPNEQLTGILDMNATALNADCYFEAVTRKDCMVTLNFGDSDLLTSTAVSDAGTVTGIAFSKVIERCNGRVDIVKMDCEGAEWDLLEEKELWKKVRAVTMEYHLWANPEMTMGGLEKKIKDLGYRVIHKTALTDSFGLLTAIRPLAF